MRLARVTSVSDPLAPQHVAIIMDGNGRWARERGKARCYGHIRGAATIRTVVESAIELKVRHLTLFAFSTENWHRAAREVKVLFRLLARFLRRECSLMGARGVRLRVIGERNRLSESLQRLIAHIEEETQHGEVLQLVLAISYGGRAEIVQAIKRVAGRVVAGEESIDSIDERTVEKHLYAPELPDVDLLIRTGSDSRISNFLLWRLAYAELLFTETKWPDFSIAEFKECLREYERRERRFGREEATFSTK